MYSGGHCTPKSSMFSLAGTRNSGRCPSTQHATKEPIHYAAVSILQAELRHAINVFLTRGFHKLCLTPVIIIPLLPHTHYQQPLKYETPPTRRTYYDTRDITSPPAHRRPKNKGVTVTDMFQLLSKRLPIKGFQLWPRKLSHTK